MAAEIGTQKVIHGALHHRAGRHHRRLASATSPARSTPRPRSGSSANCRRLQKPFVVLLNCWSRTPSSAEAQAAGRTDAAALRRAGAGGQLPGYDRGGYPQDPRERPDASSRSRRSRSICRGGSLSLQKGPLAARRRSMTPSAGSLRRDSPHATSVAEMLQEIEQLRADRPRAGHRRWTWATARRCSQISAQAKPVLLIFSARDSGLAIDDEAGLLPCLCELAAHQEGVRQGQGRAMRR